MAGEEMSFYEITALGKELFYKSVQQDHPKGTKIIVIHSASPFDPVMKGARGEVLFVDQHTGCLQVDFNGKTVSLNYKRGDRWKIETSNFTE